MLSEVQFTYFRGFRALALNGLRRVNLVVGKNNSGKTSVLEGVAVVVNPEEAPSQFIEFRQLENDLEATFRGRQYAKWVINDASPDDSAEVSGMWSGDARNVSLGATKNQPGQVLATLDGKRVIPGHSQQPFLKIRSSLIAGQNKKPALLVDSFGKAVQRGNGEELIETTLRSVDARIKKVRTVVRQNQPQILVDIGLSAGLIPLSQVGQGTYRLVEMFSEIIGASAQIAFIDEIENGIHHSCLIDVWKGLANAAANFDVQIFATTHSHECIEAAHAAFLEQPAYDFAIVQLFREAGEIQGRVLDQKHIAAGIAGDIDLRG
jgi:predicted ATP-dependent endonuclease of OLD family